MGNLNVELIQALFEAYELRKKNKTLYSSNDSLPQSLITLYYDSEDRMDFNNIVSNFKKKYIYNENEMENIHTPSERDGLSVVYDYVKDGNNDYCPNVYVIMVLHSLLYSKVPYPEFGGKLRNATAFISNSDIQSTEPSKIPQEIAALYNEYDNLLKTSEIIKETNNSSLLMQYIDRCIELKCRLIEIHPFPDGNGRTMRGMLNLLFRKVNLPPVYIKNKEKAEYIEGMDRAIRQKDTTTIKKFYYYKICDSIIDLDIKERQKNANIQKVLKKQGPNN